MPPMPVMNPSSPLAGGDHGQRFLDQYERSSLSTDTIDRFERIKRCAMRLLARGGMAAGPLSVLDVGCGAGTQALMWADAGHRVAAIDASAGLVGIGARRARERGLDLDYTIGTAQFLPFADGSFRLVLMPELLEHVAEWEACLEEAVRVLAPGGLLFLSTTNWLCPRQQEFNLPAYSWYPGVLKRSAERRALTDRPQWANHTQSPAVNWFSYYGLKKWFMARRMSVMDRFDAMEIGGRSGLERSVLSTIRSLSAARFLAHCATEGTMIWAFKPSP